ncbi:ClpX C4-type zinc finger protein [Nocardia sp. NPDC088792]
MSPATDHILACSFCSKPANAVRRIVAGPAVLTPPIELP